MVPLSEELRPTRTTQTWLPQEPDPHYAGSVDKLLNEIDADLCLRGLSWTGRTTFAGRTKALKLLLENTGQCGMQTPASVWDARLDVLGVVCRGGRNAGGCGAGCCCR